jgi:hypothetical protein
MNNTESVQTGEGVAVPRKFETRTCSRCGGSGKMPFAVYGGICFKCNGAGKFYTKRGRAAHDFLQRLRSRKAGELTAGMLVWFEGFSAGSFTVPSRFNRLVEITELKHAGRSKSGNEEWKDNFAHEVICEGKDGRHITSAQDMQTLFRVGQTALGKQMTLKLALDYQDKLTKTGTVRKNVWSNFTAEETLDRTDTREWIVR